MEPQVASTKTAPGITISKTPSSATTDEHNGSDPNARGNIPGRVEVTRARNDAHTNMIFDQVLWAIRV